MRARLGTFTGKRWAARSGRRARVHGLLGLFIAAGFHCIASAWAESSAITSVTLGNTLSWSSYDTSSGQSTSLGELGSPGDHLIFGRWTSTDFQIGVVHLESNDGSIHWKVLDQGNVSEIALGQEGDTVVSAPDFDASGRADAVVVRGEGRKLKWYSRSDAFAGGESVTEFVHGIKGEIPFFVNVDGSGDQAATLSVGKRTTSIRLYNPRTGAKRVVRGFPRLNLTSGTPVPVRIHGPTGVELVLVSQQSSGVTLLTLLDPSTRTSRTETLSGSGDLIVSDLLAEAGDEVALSTTAAIVVFNPFSGAQVSIPQTGGVLVDDINVNLVSADSVEPPPSSSPPPSDVPPSLANVCASAAPIAPGEMLIKSEASKHIHGADPRATGYTVVCGQICPVSLRYAPFYYSNGELAGAVAYYGRFSGNGQPRLYGAVGKAPQHIASQIARKAATIGNGKLYLQMSGDTSGPGTSCKEFNPTGRNGSL